MPYLNFCQDGNGRIHTMKRWQVWLGILISAVFLYIALRGLKLEEFGATLRQAQYWWLLPGITVYFLGVWVRSWRWHYLLQPIKSISTARLFPIVTIGYMGNNIYPARAGELLRAVILKRHQQVPISASLATIIIERIFDGVVMLAFIFVNLRELTKLTGDSGIIGDIQTVALFGTLFFLGALVIFLLAAIYPEKVSSLINKLSNRIFPGRFQTRLLGAVNRFLGGLEALRSPRDVFMVFMTTVIIWLLETGKYWLVMHAFSFQISYFALMLMNGLVNLATTIPSAPGYVGTFDAPGIAVLVAYGIDRATAVAYTLVLHIALWLPITLVGLYYFLREGIDVWEGIREARAEA